MSTATMLPDFAALVDPLHPHVARLLDAACRGGAVDVLVAGTGSGAWWITGVDLGRCEVRVHRHGVRRTVGFGQLRG